jgi:hypothetical protein
LTGVELRRKITPERQVGDIAVWSFGVLGPLEVRREGAVVAVAAAKHRVVLGALVLRAGET